MIKSFYRCYLQFTDTSLHVKLALSAFYEHENSGTCNHMKHMKTITVAGYSLQVQVDVYTVALSTFYEHDKTGSCNDTHHS